MLDRVLSFLEEQGADAQLISRVAALEPLDDEADAVELARLNRIEAQKFPPVRMGPIVGFALLRRRWRRPPRTESVRPELPDGPHALYADEPAVAGIICANADGSTGLLVTGLQSTDRKTLLHLERRALELLSTILREQIERDRAAGADGLHHTKGAP